MNETTPSSRCQLRRRLCFTSCSWCSINICRLSILLTCFASIYVCAILTFMPNTCTTKHQTSWKRTTTKNSSTKSVKYMMHQHKYIATTSAKLGLISVGHLLVHHPLAKKKKNMSTLPRTNQSSQPISSMPKSTNQNQSINQQTAIIATATTINLQAFYFN